MDGSNKDENDKTISETARDEKVSELKILQQSLDEKKRLADEYYDQLLRLKAEFDNFRRRTEKEKQNYLLWGKEDLLLKQLRLLDALEQAKTSVVRRDNIESITQGLELIYLEFARMIREEGIAEIESVGKTFDPQCHEAIEQVESDKEEGIITDVIQKGYTMHDRVLRAAKVKVAKKKI